MLLNKKGFTLTELIVVMAIFMAVIIISTQAFETLLKKSGEQSKIAESNIAGILGLETMRFDVEQAGFGMPSRFANWTGNVGYQELNIGSDSQALGFDSKSLNATGNRNIYPLVSGRCAKEVNGAATANGPNYLVIRSNAVAPNPVARKWAYLVYTSAGATNLSYIKEWGNSTNFVAGERVITLRDSFSAGGLLTKTVLMDSANNFYFTVPSGTPMVPPSDRFKPGDSSQTVVVYGLNNTGPVGMPYYRADYYVRRPAAGMPATCNPKTGILYKAVINHGGGFETPYSLLDCVGDMQVEYILDPTNSGNISYNISLGTLTADDVRSQLKGVRLYILAHDGKKDTSYTYPKDSIQVGDPARPSSGRTLDNKAMTDLFGSDWKNYRWSVYTFMAQIKNL